MNVVEIEAALSELAVKPFDRDEFPYAFLAAFGNKDTTLARLRKGGSANAKADEAKAKFILATEGIALATEALGSGEIISCEAVRLPVQA